jgi:hypothetical protein
VTDDDLADYLRPYLAAPSIDTLRPDFPRWRSFLASKGITGVDDPAAANWIALAVHQASPEDHSAIAHNLRNITGVRLYKG